MFRDTRITDSIFEDYLKAIGRNFCPFLLPSLQDEDMFFTEYDISRMSLRQQEHFIFYSGLIHVSIFRRSRFQASASRKKLLCENIIFSTSSDAEELFMFPHWFLKLLFTSKSILFGKFWKGERAFTKNNISIPVPTSSFLSIRSAVKPLDHRFFTLTPALIDTYSVSEDDLSCVFDFVDNKEVKSIIDLINHLDINNLNREKVLFIIELLMPSSLYSQTQIRCVEIERLLGIKSS